MEKSELKTTSLKLNSDDIREVLAAHLSKIHNLPLKAGDIRIEVLPPTTVTAKVTCTVDCKAPKAKPKKPKPEPEVRKAEPEVNLANL